MVTPQRPNRKHMLLAIKSAREGIKKGHGGPFGAVIANENGEVVAVAHNTVWKSCNPSAHAEVNAISKACRKLRSISLSGCTIYSTAEPCPMCFSAIHWARIGRVVYGASIGDAAKYGFNEMRVGNLRLKRLGRLRILITRGFMRKECARLFEEWKKSGGKPY
ncbi:MAG: nucleoside deaminase [Candidatus Micrarchaeota archaeon]|nr:nucleoside deaminase [Candidatus Micrarchaeota archaeon]